MFQRFFRSRSRSRSPRAATDTAQEHDVDLASLEEDLEGLLSMPAAASDDQIMPAAATHNQSMPAPTADDQSMPAAATDNQSMPAPTADDQGMPAAAKNSKFQTREIVVPLDVMAIGFSVTDVLPGWRDITIKSIVEQSWASLQGLHVGDEILKLNGEDVVDMDTAAFSQHMHRRPLSLLVLAGPAPTAPSTARKSGITRASQLLEHCRNMRTITTLRYGYHYMSRTANTDMAIPIKSTPIKVANVKSLLIETKHHIRIPFHEFAMEGAYV